MDYQRLTRYIVIPGLILSAVLMLSILGEGKPPLGSSQPLLTDAIPADPQIPSTHMISPEQLNQMLKAQKPLVLQIGPRSMYQQAHIPGAEYIGGTSMPEGLDALRARVKSLPKNQLIVLYCGCCPWNRCPNVHPAYKLMRDLGYTNARILYIADNFGTDWVNKGYPVEKGK